MCDTNDVEVAEEVHIQIAVHNAFEEGKERARIAVNNATAHETCRIAAKNALVEERDRRQIDLNNALEERGRGHIAATNALEEERGRGQIVILQEIIRITEDCLRFTFQNDSAKEEDRSQIAAKNDLTEEDDRIHIAILQQRITEDCIRNTNTNLNIIRIANLAIEKERNRRCPYVAAKNVEEEKAYRIQIAILQESIRKAEDRIRITFQKDLEIIRIANLALETDRNQIDLSFTDKSIDSHLEYLKLTVKYVMMMQT